MWRCKITDTARRTPSPASCPTVSLTSLSPLTSAITTVTDLQRKLAGKARVGRVETILEAQADLTSDVAKATTSAVRKVLD